MNKVLIKEIGKVITGNTPSKSNLEYYDSNDILFIKPDIINDLEVTNIEYTKEYISEKARNKARIVKRNTVFVTCIGTIGKIGIASGDEFAFNQQINAIEPNDRVLPRYLAYNLLFNKKRLINIANAPVVPIINKTQFESFSIDIDENLDKQKDIINVLDRIKNLIYLGKKQLNELENLIKSQFIKMFGDPIVNPHCWHECLLQDVMSNKASNGFFAKPKNYCEDGNAGIICVGDVVNRKYSNTDGLRRTNADKKQFQKYKVVYGDMLFCRSSLVKEGIAKASIIPKNSKDDLLFECHVIRIPLDINKVIPEFMQAFSTTAYFRGQMMDKSKTATMTTIGQKDIVTGKIFVPPMELQRQFFEFTKQSDKLKFSMQQNLYKLQELFDSLMQQFFA